MPYLSDDELKASLAIWRERFPGEVRRTRESADRHAEGYFSPAHSMAAGREIHLGSPVDWKLNPTGDPEFTWLVNRFSHAVDFGRAWALSGDEKYVRAFTAQVRGWRTQNPVDFDTPYGEAVFFQRPGPWRLLETGLRAESWLLALQLMKDSPAMDDAFREELRTALAEHADYLCRFLGSADINHAMMHMLGPLLVGLELQDHPRAPWWRQVASERFELCLRRQVNEEGVHSELTPLYHNLSLLLFARYRQAAVKSALPIPRGYDERLRAMASFTEATIRQDGLTSAFADGDPNDSGRTTLAFLGACLDDESISRKGTGDPEILWFIGPDAWRRHEPFFGTAAMSPVSFVFPRTGFFSLRNGKTQVQFDAAALGGPHGHADALSFEMCSRGLPLIVDPGRFTYEEGEWRRYFKGTGAHSTITVDDANQTPYRSSQEWGKPEAECRVSCFESNAAFDYVVASHSGYLRLGDPVSVERRILFLKEEDILVIVDVLGAKGTHSFDLRFPLNRPEKTSIAAIGDGVAAGAVAGTGAGDAWAAAAEFRSNAGKRITLGMSLKRAGAFSDTAPPRFDSGWLSDRYAFKEAIPVLSWSGGFSGKAVFVSVLRVLDGDAADRDTEASSPRIDIDAGADTVTIDCRITLRYDGIEYGG